MKRTRQPGCLLNERRRNEKMGFFAFLILGLIAGAIAKAILPGKQGGGIIITLILGVVGALLGGCIGRAAVRHGHQRVLLAVDLAPGHRRCDHRPARLRHDHQALSPLKRSDRKPVPGFFPGPVFWHTACTTFSTSTHVSFDALTRGAGAQHERQISFRTGMAAGYVLGSRSGRAAYEKLKARAAALGKASRSRTRWPRQPKQSRTKAPEVSEQLGEAARRAGTVISSAVHRDSADGQREARPRPRRGTPRTARIRRP